MREKRAGGAVMRGGRCALGDLLPDRLGELLSELDAPLVEAVDPPDGAEDEDLVFVERDEASKGEW